MQEEEEEEEEEKEEEEEEEEEEELYGRHVSEEINLQNNKTTTAVERTYLKKYIYQQNKTNKKQTGNRTGKEVQVHMNE